MKESQLKIYSVLHQKYSNWLGFTINETNELLIKAKLPVDLQQTKAWYNSYNFGGTTIYNPESIIEFIKEQGKISPYWINTSGNDLIIDLVITSESEVQEKFSKLIKGETIKDNY